MTQLIRYEQARTALAEVREFILKHMKKSPDQAGLKVVKPSRNFTVRKAA